jgi:hypothetical protein
MFFHAYRRENNMTDREILAIIRTKTYEADGRTKLTCASAHELAKEHKIGLAEIGKACNDARIKIASCELGCFT